MLKYKMHEKQNNVITYHYYPEGKGKPGKVTINTDDGKVAVVEQAGEDYGNRYAFKLIKRLSEFFNDGVYKEEGTIAWY